MKEWEEDIIELQAVLPTLKRPDNIRFVEEHIKLVQNKIEKARKEVPEKIQIKETPSVPSPVIMVDNFITITKYSYDQEGKKVKIYLTLENIGNECKQDQIKVAFTEESVQVKINNYKGQNYCYAIRKLCGRIDPSASKLTIKTNMIIITMTKTDSKNWDTLQYKQSKLDVKQPGKVKDPEAGIMNLMKQMYEEGDDNMKRTIAETWSKSNDKKKM